jgi:hypothetical protein
MVEILPPDVEEVRESVAHRWRCSSQTDRIGRMLPAVFEPLLLLAGDRLEHHPAAADQVLLFESFAVRPLCVADATGPVGLQSPGELPTLRRSELPQSFDQVVDIVCHRVFPPFAYLTL